MIFTISLTLKADGEETFHKVWRAAIEFKSPSYVLDRLFFRRFFTIDIYHSTQKDNEYSKLKVRTGAVEAGFHDILREADRIKVYTITKIGQLDTIPLGE